MENMAQNIEHHMVEFTYFEYFVLQYLLLIGTCFLDTGYVYNTEAHPIDIGSLDCCTTSQLNEKSSRTSEENTLVKKFKKKQTLF